MSWPPQPFRSAALPPSPQRRAGEAHGCGWVAGLGRAPPLLTPTLFLSSVPGLSASPKPPTQRHQRGSTKSLPTPDSLLGASPPRLSHHTRDTSHPQKVRLLLFSVKESDENNNLLPREMHLPDIQVYLPFYGAFGFPRVLRGPLG